MGRSSHVTVQVDLKRVRRNAEEIAQRTGVELIAVVKANAYGFGADAVAAAIGDIVDAFYVFDAAEVASGHLRETAERRVIALMGASENADDYLAQDIRPVVWTVERAKALKRARPIVSVDTGQQRFGCAPAEVDEVCKAGECDEIMTHATTIEQVHTLVKAAGGEAARQRGVRLHAAGSALLDQREAWLDAVRPGLALYSGAGRVAAPLADVRDSTGPAGYTGFRVPRFGVILAGYSHGLRTGPCLVNGKTCKIVEVGMQSAFVQVNAKDQSGDEVVLLGDGLEADAIAAVWRTTPQEALVRMMGVGGRKFS